MCGRQRWRWPILDELARLARWLGRRRRDRTAFGDFVGSSILWAVGVGLLAILLSAFLWFVPHTSNIQIYGRQPRPGFWILLAAAVPGAFAVVWGMFVWIIPALLRAALLFVPRRRPAPRPPLKTAYEVAALERELGIAQDNLPVTTTAQGAP